MFSLPQTMEPFIFEVHEKRRKDVIALKKAAKILLVICLILKHFHRYITETTTGPIPEKQMLEFTHAPPNICNVFVKVLHKIKHE